MKLPFPQILPRQTPALPTKISVRGQSEGEIFPQLTQRKPQPSSTHPVSCLYFNDESNLPNQTSKSWPWTETLYISNHPSHLKQPGETKAELIAWTSPTTALVPIHGEFLIGEELLCLHCCLPNRAEHLTPQQMRDFHSLIFKCQSILTKQRVCIYLSLFIIFLMPETSHYHIFF